MERLYIETGPWYLSDMFWTVVMKNKVVFVFHTVYLHSYGVSWWNSVWNKPRTCLTLWPLQVAAVISKVHV